MFNIFKKKTVAPNNQPKVEERVLSTATKEAILTSKPVSFNATDNNTSLRGMLWYIMFAIVFLVASGIIIYRRDWSLLFFAVTAGLITVWRPYNKGRDINVEIKGGVVYIGNKNLPFSHIESFNFAEIGEDIGITFHIPRRIYPKITLILLDKNKMEAVRDSLSDGIPEKEIRGEGFVEFAIRKLKL